MLLRGTLLIRTAGVETKTDYSTSAGNYLMNMHKIPSEFRLKDWLHNLIIHNFHGDSVFRTSLS